MRRKIAVLFAGVSAACALEPLFTNETIFRVSSVKASTGAEDFTIIASCYPCPSFLEVIFGMILLFTPMFALALIIERAGIYSRVRKQIKAFREDEHAAAQDFLTGKPSNQSESNGKNHISEVVSQSLRGSNMPYTNLSRPRIQIEQAKQRAVALKKVEFEKGLWAIEAIAITMPLLCLFGGAISLTDQVGGMIYTEDNITSLLASGIADAAFYLAWGSGVSIPAFWMHRLFTSKAKKLTSQLDEASARLLDLVLNYQPRPWLLESKSGADTYATQNFSRSTSALNLNRQA